MKIQVETLHCQRCGHRWVPRKTEIRLCPACKSAWFDRSATKEVPKLREVIATLKKHKESMKKNFNVERIYIFGSYARGEQTSESDIDILVEFSKTPGLEFMDLVEFLEAILNTNVDLVTKDGIKENRWKYIKEDLVLV